MKKKKEPKPRLIIPGPLIRGVKDLLGLIDRDQDMFLTKHLEDSKGQLRTAKQISDLSLTELRARIWSDRLREAIRNPKHPDFLKKMQSDKPWMPSMLKTR